MVKEIQVLKQTELLGQQFAVYGTAENPLFFAKDISILLNLSNISDMVKRVDNEERSKFNLGRQGEGWFLTEDGLYEVLMQSRKPIAKQFKKGVKAILKEIRKTGGYIAASVEESEEEIMSKALAIAQATLKRREERIKQLEQDATEQQALIEQKEETIDRQNEQIQKAAPKVNYYDEHLQSVNTVTTTQVANEIGMESHKLNQKLRDLGILYKQSGQWLLRVPYNSWGLHATRTQTFTRSDGSVGTSSYTVWTQKGRMFIIRLSENDWDVKKSIKAIKGEEA